MFIIVRHNLINKMVQQEEYRFRRLECVRRDIFRDWGLTKNWYPTMSKQGGSSSGFNFNPIDTFYGRAEVPQGQQNLHFQGETEARSEEDENRPQNTNDGTGSRAARSSHLTNLSHTLESRLPVNNHESTPNRNFRPPSLQRGFAQNILSGIGIPLSKASFLPCNARAQWESYRNRNRDNTMLEFARNVPANSTGVEEAVDEEEDVSDSEGLPSHSGSSWDLESSPQSADVYESASPQSADLICSLQSPQASGSRYEFDQESPPQSTATGQLPQFHESFGSPIRREAHQTSRIRYGLDRTMPAQSTAVGQLPQFHESYGSPIRQERISTRSVRLSPSPQFRSGSPSPTSDELLSKEPSPDSFDAQIAHDLQRMKSFENYGFSKTMPLQSTARGQLPQFHESFGPSIPKEAPVRLPRIYQYIKPNISRVSTGGRQGRSGSATPRSDEVCESPSPMSDDLQQSRSSIHGGVRYPEPRRLFQGSPFKYGMDSTMPLQSTAIGQLPEFHETFGPPIPRERPMRGLQTSRQYLQANISRTDRSASPGSCDICPSASPQSDDLRSYSRSPQSGDVRSHSPSPTSEELLRSKSSDRLGGGASPKRSYQTQCDKEHEESFMEKFDKAVEKELERYRTEGPTDTSVNISVPRPYVPDDSRALDSVTSSIDIIARMKGDQDTELTDAVEKLAKAEATVLFQGAIEAAEKAAANAPPEFAEEAAAASARAHTKIYNAELTNVVQESIPGIRPIEIVGYVGVTRPKKPLKP